MAKRDSVTLERITAAWQETSDALRESDRRYRELVEYSLGLICTHDLTGTILSINAAAASSLGYRPEDGVGRNLRDFLSTKTRPLFDDYLRRIQEVGTDAGMMSVVAVNGAKRVWMYRNVLSHGPDGTSYVLGHAIDVTERVEVERTLRRHIEEHETLSFLANFSDRLSPVVTFEEFVDVAQRLPVPFLADVAMIHLATDDGSVSRARGLDEDVAYEPALSVAATELLRTGSPAIAVEHLEGATAALLPLLVEGRVKGVFSLVTSNERSRPLDSVVLDDVARRIRLALDRIQLYREAQEANRLKDEFLSTLSHELRTPLNAIFGWARILRARDLDPSSAHAVEVIERNAEAQIRLIEEVLDVSRIITGKMTLAAETIDLRAIVRAAIDVVRPGIHAKQITLVERIDDVPQMIGDGSRLQQVFWNLLSNALKFTGSEGTITVTLRATPPLIEFEISDTGVGIRRDVLPFVFDRFRQADSSTTRSHSGLGLGLAIVRHIVELHGGKVRAASAGEGEGATFTIQLPTADEIRANGPRASAYATSQSAASPVLRGRTILVVEDHDDARDLITGVLERAGARVISASTTREAIERVQNVRPDVLLADLGLPGEDGYALLDRFRAVYPDVPAIALTAYAREADRARALAAGFQQHVVKPVDPNQLVDLVAAVTDRGNLSL